MKKDMYVKVFRSFVAMLLVAIYVSNINSMEEMLEVKNLVGGILYLAALLVFAVADVSFYKRLLGKS